MSIPEVIMWAINDSEENLNHVSIECPQEKRELFKELFEEKFTSEKIREMTALVKDQSVELYDDYNRYVDKEGNSDSDIELTEDGFSWSFNPHKLSNYDVSILSTDNGFLITYGIPMYTVHFGDYTIDTSFALQSTLDYVKNKIPELEYDGCDCYCWIEVRMGDSEYNEFSSRDKKDNENIANDYIGKKLNELFNSERFLDSFEERLDDDYDPDELIDFIILYKGYIDEECICNISKILIPLYIKENDYKSIKTISEWNNAITEENILEFIELASENVDNGGDVQITAFLLNYKNEHFPEMTPMKDIIW